MPLVIVAVVVAYVVSARFVPDPAPADRPASAPAAPEAAGPPVPGARPAPAGRARAS
jgi:hypothetical protein